MKIEFACHENELESIDEFLERNTFPAELELKKIFDKLSRIDESIDLALEGDAVAIGPYLEKQKELVKKLEGRRQKLEIQKDVISLAEAAEALANSSPLRPLKSIIIEAQELRDKIDLFLQNHRPSKTNAKFIRFARACLAKAEKQEPIISKSTQKRSKNTVSLDNFRVKEASLDSLELAEMLYDLARVLYEEKYDEFKDSLEGNFSPSQQKEIGFHISKCFGNLQSINDQVVRLKCIQGILGYAHVLSDYYMGDTPYPTIVEIHNIFQDLAFINQQEEESN